MHATSSASPNRSEIALTNSSWTIVLVDHRPDDRAETRRFLLRSGERPYQFIEADTEAIGLARYRAAIAELPIACIILEHAPPHVNGFELLAALSGSGGITECPVVFLCASVSRDDARALIRAGAQDCLGKSWTTAEGLAHAVELAVARWSMTRESPQNTEARARDGTTGERSTDDARRREQRLRLALRAGGTGVWTWDITNGHVEWSEECYAIAGLHSQDGSLSFEDFERLIHPEDRGAVLAAVQRALGGAEYCSEFRIVRGDDVVRHVTNLGLVERDATGAPLSMLGTITDVTEQRLAAIALRERERELRSITDNTPDILARFDRNLRHVFVNAAIEPVTGMPAHALLGKSNRDLGMPPALCDLWDERLAYVFETGLPVSYEFEIDVLPSKRFFAARLVPEHDASGAVAFVLCVSHDVTELKQVLSTLNQADRSKDMFLAMLAHELRNPLAPITTGLELLRLTNEHDAKLRTLAMMQRQVAHMVRLIDDLMDVSRIASGKVTIRRERMCLQDVASLAVETTRAVLARGQHEFVLELSPDSIWVDGDPTRLTQVIGNLLTNAAKYTPNAGRIRLSVHRDRTQALVVVEDSGLGIPPDMISRIFDMFTQVNQTLERAQGGLGIGLALVKHLVEMHGGSVHAHSEGAGRGSLFEVRLPLAEPVTVAMDLETGGSATSLAACRALVVDDDIDAAESLADMLVTYGSDVRVAFHGAEALRVAAEFRPQIVFLDIGMPQMNGYEAARRFREEPAFANVTLVALTGWVNEEHLQRSREAGFDYHHTKPLAATLLRELLTATASGG